MYVEIGKAKAVNGEAGSTFDTVQLISETPDLADFAVRRTTHRKDKQKIQASITRRCGMINRSHKRKAVCQN